MKKYLFLIPLLLVMLIPSIDVNALTYVKDDETIEVTGDNFLYYVYQNYSEDFENYKYIIATTDKTYSYKVVLSNVEPILQSNNILLYNIPENDTAISYNYYVSSDSFKKQESTNTSFAANNISYLRFHNFDFNNEEANISLNELKSYFGESSEVEPSPSPTESPEPSPTISPTPTESPEPSPTTSPTPDIDTSEDFDSPVHDISVSILGSDIPQEFDFLYMIMDIMIIILIIFCVISPFVIIFKIMGVL